MKEMYGIDMEKEQYSKLISDIPSPDIAISMGCNVGCPFIGRKFDYNWELDDPTGKTDEEFISTVKKIEKNIFELKNAIKQQENYINIYETETRTFVMVEKLVKVWEESVRSTHLFLSEQEIGQIKEYDFAGNGTWNFIMHYFKRI